MRKNLREDEKKISDSYCESNNIFIRLSKRLRDSKHIFQNVRYKKTMETEKVVQRHSEAIDKVLRADGSAWMKKRKTCKKNQV